MAHLLETHLRGDLADGPVGLPQELGGLGEAELGEILVGGGLQALPEAPEALRLADVGAGRQLLQGHRLGVMLPDVLKKDPHPGLQGAGVGPVRRSDVLLEFQPQSGEIAQGLVGVEVRLLLLQEEEPPEIGQDRGLPGHRRGEVEEGKVAVPRGALHQGPGGAAGIEGEEVVREDKGAVMAGAGAVHPMDHVLVDEDPLSRLQGHDTRQSLDLDGPLRQVGELQVLVPVHHLKARGPGVALAVDPVQHQIGEIRPGVEVDGVDEGFVVHGNSPF